MHVNCFDHEFSILKKQRLDDFQVCVQIYTSTAANNIVSTYYSRYNGV